MARLFAIRLVVALALWGGLVGLAALFGLA